MDAAVLAAILGPLVTGIFSVAGITISNIMSNRKVEHTLETQQAVTDTKLEAIQYDLTEVKKMSQDTLTLKERVDSLRRDFDNTSKRLDEMSRRIEELQKEINRKGG